MKRWLIVVFIGILCAAASAQPSAKPAICSFIQKVVEARADSFAAIRSTEEDQVFKTFEGKLTPDARSKCTAYPQHERNGKTEGAVYICNLPRAKSMAEMKPAYERLKSEIQACYADMQFHDKSSGSEATHDESWAAVGGNNNVRLTLQAMDMRYAADAAPDMVNDETKRNPATLTLSIRAR